MTTNRNLKKLKLKVDSLANEMAIIINRPKLKEEKDHVKLLRIPLGIKMTFLVKIKTLIKLLTYSLDFNKLFWHTKESQPNNTES